MATRRRDIFCAINRLAALRSQAQIFSKIFGKIYFLKNNKNN